MPPWERFKELGQLPFVSTVQEFADQFQVVACHAQDISTRLRAKLFISGLSNHIRVDVEIRDPLNLQTAMYYARAFERQAAAMQSA